MNRLNVGKTVGNNQYPDRGDQCAADDLYHAKVLLEAAVEIRVVVVICSCIPE